MYNGTHDSLPTRSLGRYFRSLHNALPRPPSPRCRRFQTLGSPEHLTEASSLCPQSLCPQFLAGQSHREDSLPLHFTSLSHMGPVPWPNAASFPASRAKPHPSWRHTTWASLRSQESSHTVPQEPPCQTSTRPEQLVVPSSSLILSEKSGTPWSFLRKEKLLEGHRRKEKFETLF